MKPEQAFLHIPWRWEVCVIMTEGKTTACTWASRQQGVPGSLVPMRDLTVRHDPYAFILSNASQLPCQESRGIWNRSRHGDQEERPRHLRVPSEFTYSYLRWRQSQDYTTELKRNGIFDFTIMHIAALIRRDLLQRKSIPQSIRYVYIFSLTFVSFESFALTKDKISQM